jgi:hypothetical protein
MSRPTSRSPQRPSGVVVKGPGHPEVPRDKRSAVQPHCEPPETRLAGVLKYTLQVVGSSGRPANDREGQWDPLLTR